MSFCRRSKVPHQNQLGNWPCSRCLGYSGMLPLFMRTKERTKRTRAKMAPTMVHRQSVHLRSRSE